MTACAGCETALARAQEIGLLTQCPICGAQWEQRVAYNVLIGGGIIDHRGLANVNRASVRRAHTRARPHDPDRRVRDYVANVLAWDAATARVERSARGDRSPLAGLLATLELEIVGTGCKGTHGVGRAPHDDPDPTHVDPIASARYRSLRGEALLATDAVIADGQGDQIIEIALGPTQVECSLAQRVALRIASLDEILAWNVKFAERDSKPALRAMEADGRSALVVGAEAWWNA